jgi:Zn-dependent protease with chaperone function
MTLEQLQKFDALVQRIEKSARRKPAQYKLRLGFLAVLGYAYILFVFLLLCAFIWGLRQVASYTNLAGQQLGTITLLLTLGVLRLFWVNLSRPRGLELSRQQVPQLFALIEELTAKLQAPKFDHILLTNQLNAGVFQRPRFGFVGWQQNYLLLGLPLMQALSPEQFRAVVAHELAHLSGNDSRFAGWIYRIRKVWFELAEKFQQDDSRGLFLFRWFFNWYSPFFKAYSFVLARAEEYEADQRAAFLTSVQHKAEALIQLTVNKHFLYEFFWPSIYQQALELAQPPDDTFTKLLTELPYRGNPEQAAKWIELALAEKTSNEDTHPCLTERLAALGYQVTDITLPAPVDETASERFLGTDIKNFAAHLDEEWKKDVEKSWKQRHIHLKQQQRNLEYLEAKALYHSLTVEEAWKRASLSLKLKDLHSAIPLFQAVLDQKPEHPLANYQLGRLLIEKNEASGIDYLERAIANDPALVTRSCELLYEYYKQQGQLEKATAYQQKGEQHQETWKLGEHERQTVSYYDQFAPHNLSEVEIQQLAEQLSNYPEVRKAYLACKQLTHFPEKPLYVLGIIRRFVKGIGSNYKSDSELINQIETELNFSRDVHVIIFQQNNIKLRNILVNLKGTCIYNY